MKGLSQVPHNYDYTEPKKLISNARLSSYKNSLGLNNDAELLGAYSWNLTLVGAFYPLIQLIEVALRNTINEVAQLNISTTDGQFWFQAISFTQEVNEQGAPCNPEQVKKFKNKFANAKKEARRALVEKNKDPDTVTLDQIISKTDFSVWEYILDKNFYNGSDNNYLWPSKLTKAFKKLPRVTHKNPMFHQRDSIRRRIEEVRAFRNRISHNEPAWRVSDISSPEEVIAVLNEKLDNMIELLYWISPKFKRYACDVGLESRIRQILNLKEFNRYIHTFDTYEIADLDGLIKLVEKANLENNRFYVKFGAVPAIIAPYNTRLLQ